MIQLDRNNAGKYGTGAYSVFLAQVTNSVLDPITRGTDFPPSKLVVVKLTKIGNSPPAPDATFGTSGVIKLSADASPASNQLCGVKTSLSGTCVPLPADARPTGTPVAVLTNNSGGFQLYTTWYSPPQSNWDNCPNSDTNGNSYITVHEFEETGTWAQLYGVELQHQYVTGVQFVGTTLFITTGDGTSPMPGTGGVFNQAFQPVTKTVQTLTGDRFVKTAWTERMDD